MSEKMLTEFSLRLGVSDRNTIEKSKEIFRLIGVKKCKINETVKTLISIECAAKLCNSEFHTDVALKLSGLKQKEYVRNKELIEKLLEFGKRLTLDEICAQLEISDLIKKDAAQLLNEYSKSKLLVDEINNPHYLAMAIYQSCQMRKYKTSNVKSKLMQLSRLGTKNWKVLENDWVTWMEEHSSVLKHVKTANANTQAEESGKNQKNCNDNITQTEPKIQPYEEWHENMIKQANAELQKIRER